MAKYTGPACRQCRREGCKMFLKGDRCYTGKCAIEKRNQIPGQHAQGRKNVKEYGLQLREKQKAKRYYGILETQFRNYFKKAEKREGMTGDNLLILIERRFDNVIYRAGFAESRRDARQLVLHGHFTLNGKKANIPSMTLSAGDVVALKASSRDLPKFKAVAESIEGKSSVKWLDVNKENLTATITALPARGDIDFEIQDNLIVELYSK
ncbi:30S ribosomal protein S4 [bioreactor metagenome]|uniref:30S ribosomal protein S4 n=1 Tax=bioreactor metagenome TaxID=1076179 RepID=A0A645B170_9ZZZZ|nr:30S ribosomal protein S4 [Oscillospiraceae bacterium]